MNAVATAMHKIEEQEVPLKGWLAVVGSALGAFMAVLDIQITSSSLKDIQGAFGAGIDEGSWISSAYLIAEIITIPLTGWLSRVFGVKKYVLTNAILFLIFSMLCGCAWDLNSMIAFRALQGFTGGTLIPMAFSIILSTLPPAKRPIGLAMFSITAVFAPSIGPAIGGYLTDTFGWRYIFFLNLFPGLLLIGLLIYSLPKSLMQLDLIKKGDYWGIATMAVGLSCLIYALEEGQRKDWFGSDVILKCSIIAAIFLTAFIIIEFTTKQPLVNVRLLFKRNFGFGSFANVALGMSMYGSVYLIPLYLTTVQGYSAAQIGQVMVWSGLPQLLITPFIPKLLNKIDARLLLVYGLLAMASSSFMNAFMSQDYSGPQLIFSMVIRALGQPFIMVPLSTLTTAGIAQEEAGSASSLFNMMRNLGGSVGIALFSTLLTQREQFHSERLTEVVTDANPAFQSWMTNASATFHHQGLSNWASQQGALAQLAGSLHKEAYVMAFNDCFLAVGIVLTVACATAFTLKKVDASAGAAVE